MLPNDRSKPMWALMTCVVAACSPSPRVEVESRGDVTPTPENITAGWPGASRDAATALIAKYGAPDESTPTLLIWHNKGPWKRTVLYKEEVPHSFPKPHVDVLEQFIDYRVPVDKFDDLAAYDGSVIVERTKGEISARCDKEPMNFLALNLTHDVVTGKLTVDAARAEYSRQAMAFMSQQPAPYTEGLKFNVARGGTADPDVPRPPQ